MTIKQQLELQIEEGRRSIDALQTTLNAKIEALGKSMEILQARDKEIQTLGKQVHICSTNLLRREKSIEKLNEANATLAGQVAEMTQMYEVACKTGEQLRKELTSLKEDKHLPRTPILRKFANWLILWDNMRYGKTQ